MAWSIYAACIECGYKRDRNVKVVNLQPKKDDEYPAGVSKVSKGGRR